MQNQKVLVVQQVREFVLTLQGYFTHRFYSGSSYVMEAFYTNVISNDSCMAVWYRPQCSNTKSQLDLAFLYIYEGREVTVTNK